MPTLTGTSTLAATLTRFQYLTPVLAGTSTLAVTVSGGHVPPPPVTVALGGGSGFPADWLDKHLPTVDARAEREQAELEEMLALGLL